MYSIRFPKMLSNTRTNLASDHEATMQNLILMLKSDKTSLFGDPYFGTLLKRMLFDQNSLRLQDLVVDELYTSIQTFMPQVIVKREDIRLTAEKDAVYVSIKCMNLIDYQINLYTIKLTENNDTL